MAFFKPGLMTALVVVALGTLMPRPANAHCDTMSGPVVTAAKAALETGNVNLVLIWVPAEQEDAIQLEFRRALSARQADDRTRRAAEIRFFEAVVRIHRVGEGAPYTGIAPEGTDLGVAVPAADQALEAGSHAPVQDVLAAAVQSGVSQRLREALDRQQYHPDDVAAGREYVRSYVEYTHYVEGVYDAATASGHHPHGPQSGEQSSGDSHRAHHVHQSLDSDGQERHLPWVLVAVLGVLPLLETGWLLARKR